MAASYRCCCCRKFSFHVNGRCYCIRTGLRPGVNKSDGCLFGTSACQIARAYHACLPSRPSSRFQIG